VHADPESAPVNGILSIPRSADRRCLGLRQCRLVVRRTWRRRRHGEENGDHPHDQHERTKGLERRRVPYRVVTKRDGTGAIEIKVDGAVGMATDVVELRVNLRPKLSDRRLLDASRGVGQAPALQGGSQSIGPTVPGCVLRCGQPAWNRAHDHRRHRIPL
jgi:hypothetical protein